MKKRILISLLVLAVAISFMPVSTFAAPKTIKSTTYNTIKKGNIVYCTGNNGIYKAKIKKGKVRSKKMLNNKSYFALRSSMTMKGNFIYYVEERGKADPYLVRVKKNGGKVQTLASLLIEDYAIKGNKIYYCSGYSEKYDKYFYKSMNLNGKAKKKSNVVVVTKIKTTNANGYKAFSSYKKDVEYDYLKTPKGKYLLKKKKY